MGKSFDDQRETGVSPFTGTEATNGGDVVFTSSKTTLDMASEEDTVSSDVDNQGDSTGPKSERQVQSLKVGESVLAATDLHSFFLASLKKKAQDQDPFLQEHWEFYQPNKRVVKKLETPKNSEILRYTLHTNTDGEKQGSVQVWGNVYNAFNYSFSYHFTDGEIDRYLMDEAERLFKNIEYKSWGREISQTYGSRSSFRNQPKVLLFEAIVLYYGQEVWKTLAKNLSMSVEELNLVEDIHSKLSKFDIEVIRSTNEPEFKYQHFNKPGKLLFIVRENASSGIDKPSGTRNPGDGFYRASDSLK